MKEKYLISILDEKTKRLKTYDVRTGELVNMDRDIAGSPDKILPCEQVFDAIANLIVEGKSLTSISKLEGMPKLTTLYRWQDKFPAFGNKIRAAKRYRADYYREKAENLLEETETKDDTVVNKFKFDGYMKLAEKDNPQEYGSTANVQSGSGAVLNLIVNTGIVRDSESDEDIIEGEVTNEGKNIRENPDEERVCIQGETSEQTSQEAEESQTEEKEEQQKSLGIQQELF